MKASHAVPRLGVFRPPLIYLASIATGLGLHWAWPRPVIAGGPAGLLGGALVAVSLLLFGFSVQRFRAAGTPVPARKPTTAIVRTGPYRFSRNPIYLAFSLLQLGIAIWVGSWWLVATLAAAIADHPVRRRAEGGAVSRDEIRWRVPRLQGLRAPLVVGQVTWKGSRSSALSDVSPGRLAGSSQPWPPTPRPTCST